MPKKYNYTKKTGRPSKTVANCLPENWKEVIIDMSTYGMSDVEIRAKLCLLGGKFNYDTWYALKKREVEFAETLKIGKVLCQGWWEEQGRSSLRHDKQEVFETGLWYANMKNRFGWSDKQEISTKDGIPLVQIMLPKKE